MDSTSEGNGLTACCPANIARLVTSVGNYIYGKSNDGIWVNLFVGSNTNIKLSNTDVALKMETNYPWDGKVKINIDPTKKTEFKCSHSVFLIGRREGSCKEIFIKMQMPPNQFYFLL